MFKAKHEIDVIANSIPGGVLKIRMKDMKILYANDGYYMLSGYSRAEFHINFGDYCDKIIYPADMRMVFLERLSRTMVFLVLSIASLARPVIQNGFM